MSKIGRLGAHVLAAEMTSGDLSSGAVSAASAAKDYGTLHNLRYGRGLLGKYLGQWRQQEVVLSDGSRDIATTLTLNPLYYYPTLLLCCLIGYLLGSVNFAILISGRKYHDDVREHGSGNAGMTNMLRTYGKKAAILTFVGDFLKGAVAVLIGLFAAGEVCAYLTGFFCILGHSFPIFSHFKGGKGVATTAGVILALEPWVFLVLFGIFLLVFFVTKYVSLASVMGMIFYPVVLNGMYFNFLHRDLKPLANTPGSPLSLPLLIAIAIAVLVVLRHRANILRLFRREEPKTDLTRLFKKGKEEEQ